MSSTLAIAQFGMMPALASALLHSLWQCALLAVAAALTLRAMAAASAATRHNVGLAFQVAMLLVPAAQFARFWTQSGADLNAGLLPVVSSPQLDQATNSFVQHSTPLAAIMVMCWLAGVVLMLIRHVGSLRAVARMERQPHQSLPPSWQARVEQLRGAMAIARTVSVRLSDEVLAPCAARVLRPVIWLPASLVTRVPAEHLEALLAHEMAHIARRDWLWNGVQCIIESILFFHPAVWWLGRRIRQEREHAADDLAVKADGDAIALAEALTTLECERHSSPRLVLAATGGSLMQRVTRLLTGPPSRGRWGALAIVGALAISGGVVLTQLGLAGGGFPDLQVQASTNGALGPNDYREIRADGIDKRRYYRASVDARGKLTEVYKENGEVRPINAAVVRWVDEVTRLSIPAPGHPIVPDHQFPHIEDSADFKALVALIGANPKVAGRLGTPVALTSKPVNGNIEITDADGNADITLELQGPSGRATVAVDADMKNHIWSLQKLDLS